MRTVTEFGLGNVRKIRVCFMGVCTLRRRMIAGTPWVGNVLEY